MLSIAESEVLEPAARNTTKFPAGIRNPDIHIILDTSKLINWILI